ncbi:hypothetical protein ON010_g4075 [Phytophthora cinnamomi]|nr:hypothetical protein ON010_g4075 [Phytophthora cinnamomi]
MAMCSMACFHNDRAYVKAHGEEPQVVGCEERLGERAIFRVREVVHGARDKLAVENERQRVDVPQQLIS